MGRDRGEPTLRYFCRALRSACCAGVTAGLPKAAVELLALLLFTQKGA